MENTFIILWRVNEVGTRHLLKAAKSKYEKSERAMKLWRGACVITTITTITAVAIALK